MANYKTRIKNKTDDQLMHHLDHLLDMVLVEAKFPEISRYESTAYITKHSYAEQEAKKRGLI